MDDIGLLLEQATARYPEQARFLWGHSLGGGLVLNYALRRRPDLQGVIATSPWLDLAFSPSWAKVAVGRIAARVWPSLSMANALDTQALCHDPQVVREYLRDPLVHDRISAQLGISMLDAGKWALAHAREFSLPLLLVHGGVDRITSARATREFASRVPRGCTLKLWEGLYHETHNEPQKNEVLSHIVDWIKTHTSRDDRAPGNGRARWDVAGPDLTGSSWQRKETI